VDLRRLRAGEWIAAVAGAVLVVSLFLPWYEAGDVSSSAWEAFGLMDVLLLVSGAMGIALLVITAVQRTAAVGIATDAITLIVTAAIAVVALIRVLNLPDDLGADAGRATFAWIGLLAAFGVPGGALLAMRDERLSKPGRPTDSSGVPVASVPEVETLPAPPRGAA
jgi:hypothetical protein